MPPDLIVGHGVLGRLLARLNVAAGCTDTVVWEVRPATRATAPRATPCCTPTKTRGATTAPSTTSAATPRSSTTLIGRLAPGGEIVLAGFYSERVSFSFPTAFMREAQIRAAAEWQRPDLLAVKALIEGGVLSLDGLITHHAPFAHADSAYRTAFGDVGCLKMILDWTH